MKNVGDVQNYGQSPYYFIADNFAVYEFDKPKTVLPNTVINRNGDYSYSVTFSGTEILRTVPDGQTILNNGGHMTATTKQRMNAFLPKRVQIVQRKGSWFVVGGKGTTNERWIPYVNGMTLPIDYNGHIAYYQPDLARWSINRCHELAFCFVVGTDWETDRLPDWLTRHSDFLYSEGSALSLTIVQMVEEMIAGGLRMANAA